MHVHAAPGPIGQACYQPGLTDSEFKLLVGRSACMAGHIIQQQLLTICMQSPRSVIQIAFQLSKYGTGFFLADMTIALHQHVAKVSSKHREWLYTAGD